MVTCGLIGRARDVADRTFTGFLVAAEVAAATTAVPVLAAAREAAAVVTDPVEANEDVKEMRESMVVFSNRFAVV